MRLLIALPRVRIPPGAVFLWRLRMRGIAYNRDVSKRKAIRKKKLSDSWLHGSSWYDNLHQYSKNKIHCSCNICSCKTNQHHECSHGVGEFLAYYYIDKDGIRQKKTRTHLWGTSHSGYRKNWKISDLKKIQEMQNESKEYYEP